MPSGGLGRPAPSRGVSDEAHSREAHGPARRPRGLFTFAAAAPVRADDWALTGTGVRVKTIAFIDIDVYEIGHFMKQTPASRSKQAVIDADVPKKFVWKMLRDVDKEKIHDALTGAFAMNGYKDQAKIKAFVGAFQGS